MISHPKPRIPTSKFPSELLIPQLQNIRHNRYHRTVGLRWSIVRRHIVSSEKVAMGRIAVWCIAATATMLAGCVPQPFQTRTTGAFDIRIEQKRSASPIVHKEVQSTLPKGFRGVVAVIDVDGLLVNSATNSLVGVGENPVSLFREKLDAAASLPCLSAVVLRINSPGGGVTACDILRRDLVAFRQRTGVPVYACLMDLGTGGAYYLATACDQIYAHPTSLTGGIGVIYNVYSLENTMLQFEAVDLAVKSGEHIDLGSPTHKLTPEGRAILQRIADGYHATFVNAVKAARPKARSLPPEWFDGRILTAQEALGAGLVDTIAYLDDVIVAAGQAGPAASRAVLLRRADERGQSIYDISPVGAPEKNWLPVSIPGLERSRLPMFLYLWQPDPTIERTLAP